MFKLQFSTDNATFEDEPVTEVERIMRLVTDQVAAGLSRGPILDVNGNRIGEWDWRLAE